MEADGNIDGSDIFWPGYVDAVTNLVLNLLFMLTILIIAVFMFALELSRHQVKAPTNVAVVGVDDQRPVSVSAEQSPGIAEAKDSEIQALQKELLSLKKQVQVQNDLRNTQKTVIAKTPIAKADKDLDKAAANGGGIIVKFMADAVTLSPTEAEGVRNLLAPIVASGAAKIEVIAPAGFSEAKRLGFYRAMAVRNELIEMKLAATKIEVSVREGKSGADNTKVLVSPR